MKNAFTKIAVGIICSVILLSSLFLGKVSAQCSGMPAAGTVSAISIDTICAGSAGMLRLIGNSTGAGITFRWQQMPSIAANWTNAGGNDSASTLTTQPLSGTTWFRCAITCTTSGLSDTTSAFRIYSPGLLSVDNDTACSPGNYWLWAHGVGSTKWYVDNITGTPLASNDSLNVTVAGDSTFYEESTYFKRWTGGAPDNTMGAGGNTMTLTHGLVFHSFTDFTLDTIYMYPTSAGSMKVFLADSVGNTNLDSVSVSFTAGQVNMKIPIPLYWNVNAGHTYYMKLGSVVGQSPYRNTAGPVYPYITPGVMAITRNINNQAGAYYFFYDWRMHVGCTSARVPVLLHIGPITVTATTSDDSICTGSTVTLHASGASSYSWQPGSLSGSTLILAPGSTTNYTVTGTAGAGCSDSATVLVHTGSASAINVFSNDANVCPGSSVTLTASGGGSTFQWAPISMSGNNVTITALTTTTYTATGTNPYGCVASDTTTVFVIPVTVIASSSADTICLGSPVTLNATGADTYVWQPGGSTGASYTLTPSTTNTYTVTGTITSNGCTAASTKTVELSYVSLSVFVTPNDTVCPGAAITLSAVGANTYLWTPGPQTGSSAHYNPTVTTNYTVIGTNTIGCKDTSYILINTASALPSAGFGFADTNGHYTFTNNSVNGVSYLWLFGDGNSSTLQNPGYTYSAHGDFVVTLIVTNPCGTDTAFQTIHFTGIRENADPENFYLSVSPNPSKGISSISYSLKNSSEVYFEVLDELGRQVFRSETRFESAGSHTFLFDSSILNNGIYFCKLSTAKGSESVKLVLIK